MKEIKISNISFILFTMLLVLMSAFCITKTVQSQSNVEQAEIEQYYRAQEEELVDEVRTYLNESGFRNSGVMLTRVVAEDGLRQYTLTIHHDKISKMEAAQQEELKQELVGFYFSAENCIFYHEFLVLD